MCRRVPTRIISKTRSSFLCLCLVILAASSLHSAGEALDESFTEQQVKAAFLFNFVRFVDWPEAAFQDRRSPIVFAVVGDDRMSGILAGTLQGKQVNGRPLVLRPAGSAVPKEMHVLFVGESEAKNASALIERIKGQSVLIVGETDGFVQRGGMINFYIEETRVRFEINVGAAEGAGLKISSRLLSLARIVRGSHGARS